MDPPHHAGNHIRILIILKRLCPFSLNCDVRDLSNGTRAKDDAAGQVWYTRPGIGVEVVRAEFPQTLYLVLPEREPKPLGTALGGDSTN